MVETAKEVKGVPVALVRYPKGWKPATPDAKMPEVEIHYLPTPELAKLFAKSFNRREFETGSSGFWAAH